MAVIIGFSALIIAIIGFLIWFWNVSKPKPWADFGRIMFACGLLAFALTASGQLASCNASSSGAAVHIGR